MQILENKIIKNYILPIVFIPILCLISMVIINFIFSSGKYFGTFLRALYELVLKNVK